MRTIRKEQEPLELREYRSQPDAHYDGPLFTSVNDKIKEQLLREQGYLCAYCMGRINENAMKTEHWRCRDRYPDEDLRCGNLLGVCCGNEGQTGKNQTCDTRKGNKDLRYNPADPLHDVESRVRYTGDGKIHSTEKTFCKQLNKTLNLNHVRLVKNRKAVMDAVMQQLGSRPGSRTPSEIRRMRDRWMESDLEAKLPEYYGVAVYFLDKRLRRK